jgi:hypothetical protein
MDNFTTGHESLCGFLEYPDNHIEINPQFRVCLHRLIDKYPDALFVHLFRSRESCVESLCSLGRGSVMRAYESLHPSVMRAFDLREVARCYYDFETRLIDLQLGEASLSARYRMEDWRLWWRGFWEDIGATGDYEAALESWETPKNTREERGEG